MSDSARHTLWFLSLAPLACADLSPIEEGLCGNEVLESGEDCDVHPDPALGHDLSCGAPDDVEGKRCRYVCNERSLCPDGWDCGMDRVCRAPAGALRADATLPWAPDSFQVLDFNGDGRIDLAGAFARRLEFRRGDGSGRFAEPFDPATPTLPVSGEIAVVSLDRDDFDDVVLPAQGGNLVWRGQAEGPPTPVAFALFPLGGFDTVRILPVRHPDQEETIPAILLPEWNGQVVLSACLYVEDTLEGCGTLDPDPLEPHSLEDAEDRVHVVDLDDDGRDELVFGFAGAGAIEIFSVRQDLLRNDLHLGGFPVPRSLPLEVDVTRPRRCESCEETTSSQRIHRNVAVVDVDGDGILDLLASVTALDGSEDTVVVARGLVEGGFAQAYVDARFEQLASPDTVEVGMQGELSPWPIAAGDLDGDGAADYVSPHGVFLAREGSLVQIHRSNAPAPWTAALVTDFDGDGRHDVAAIRAGEPRVDLLRCDVDRSFCDQRPPYDTELGVTKLRAGSLQGGGLMDLLLVESGGAGSDQADALSVMYGRPLEWPDGPVRHGRFHQLEDVRVGSFGYPGEPGLDHYDDALLVAKNRAGEGAAGVLFATGTKQLSSPYFADSSSTRASQALAGRFTAQDQPFDDLVLVGSNGNDEPRAWFVPGAEDAALAPNPSGQDLRTTFNSPGLGLDCAQLARGDVDGDGVDEVVGVAGGAICGEPETTIVVGRASSAGGLSFTRQEVALVEEQGGGHITTTDLDGDGRDDLVIARPGRLDVLWAGAAQLGPLSSSVVGLDSAPVLSVIPFARSSGARGANRVAVLTETSLVVIHSDEVSPDLQLTAWPSARAHGVQSADVDGDGLGDLLLLSSEGLTVWRSQPTKPLGS